MMTVYIKLEKPTELQTFWINYLRDDDTYIINHCPGNMNKTFDDIPDVHKSDCKKVSIGANIFPINKEFFTYAKRRPKENQRYIEHFVDPETGRDLLIHDPDLTTIKKISYKKFTWFFNSEPYNEIELDYRLLDELHCMPTGFKANWILSRSYTRNTTVYYYDFNNYMLKFKRKLIETWDGYDYPAFINNYGFKQDLLPDNFNKELLETEWQFELSRWGGANAFARLWNYQRQLDYKFIEIDLFNDFEKIKITGNATCWFSNVFFYPTLFLKHDHQYIWNKFNNFMHHLTHRFPLPIIYTKDPFGWSHRNEKR